MSAIRADLDRVEATILRFGARLRGCEDRLDALEQAVIELSDLLRRQGEVISPGKEKE